MILVTPGDPDGIGPEIVWKTLRSRSRRNHDVLCVGAREPFDRLGVPVAVYGQDSRPGRPHVWLMPAPHPRSPRRSVPGYQSGWSIETATRLLLDGRADALVTGPICKERLQKGGYPFPGHTEFLASLCGVRDVTMMLANSTLRVSLVTTHLALGDVPRALTRARIRRAVLQTQDHLRRWWGIRRPRIAVTALNPHAGEGGLFGREEISVISPELRALRAGAGGRFVLDGPLPADTLFANHSARKPAERHDAVVCMYHDQGLIPVKLLDFGGTVNVTLGLPIIRTSVDHGVAFDLAGTGRADPSSFRSALGLAETLIKRRKKT